MRSAGHVACTGDERGAYWVLVGKPAGRRPIGRPCHRWEDNIKIDLQEVVCRGMYWVDLDKDADICWASVNLVL
jgi:hypothetical protein